MQHYHFAPDNRRTPRKKLYCANCHRDLESGRDYIRVSIDFDLMEIWADSSGKYYIGVDCWKQIKKSPVELKQ